MIAVVGVEEDDDIRRAAGAASPRRHAEP